MKLSAVFFALSLLVTIAVTPAATRADEAGEDVAIDEWQVPYEASRPRDPYVDGSGRVWFCGQAGKYLAYLKPESGEFAKFDLADGAGPHNLIVDDQGQIWFAANTLPYIGRLDPESGDVVRFEMPDGKARDPHTLVFDADGNIWFTAQRSNYVGHLDIGTGDVRVVEVGVERARPYGIRLDSRGHPWVALFGTNRLATIDPRNMTVKIIDLPREKARVRRLEITSDDKVWYADYAQGILGRFAPASGDFDEWNMPGGKSARPYGTALDDRQVMWIAEGGEPNRLVGFDTASEEFVSVVEVPSARGAIRHMYFHAATREIWFGEDSNFIGRAKVP